MSARGVLNQTCAQERSGQGQGLSGDPGQSPRAGLLEPAEAHGTVSETGTRRPGHCPSPRAAARAAVTARLSSSPRRVRGSLSSGAGGGHTLAGRPAWGSVEPRRTAGPPGPGHRGVRLREDRVTAQRLFLKEPCRARAPRPSSRHGSLGHVRVSGGSLAGFDKQMRRPLPWRTPARWEGSCLSREGHPVRDTAPVRPPPPGKGLHAGGRAPPLPQPCALGSGLRPGLGKPSGAPRGPRGPSFSAQIPGDSGAWDQDGTFGTTGGEVSGGERAATAPPESE